MPLLFVALSVLAVITMGVAKASSTTPPMLPGPAAPPVVSMQPGEVWAVAGTIDHDMTEEAWQSFHDTLSAMMTSLGGRIGKLVHDGARTFAIQVQPTTAPVTIQVPMTTPPFTITSVKKLQATQVSGRRYA